MTHIEFNSRVGSDGVLSICLPLGSNEANREVKVIVEPTDLSSMLSPSAQEPWSDFVKDMAGCISDPTFLRPEQGEYERRTEAFP
jgi:hypothetical protein